MARGKLLDDLLGPKFSAELAIHYIDSSTYKQGKIMSEITGTETRISVGAVVQSSLPTRAQVGWIIVLLTVLVVGLTTFIAIRFTGSALLPTQKWEYKIVSPKDLSFDIEVNKLGQLGWELVSARRATSGSGYSSEASYEMILKRPLSASSGSGKK